MGAGPSRPPSVYQQRLAVSARDLVKLLLQYHDRQLALPEICTVEEFATSRVCMDNPNLAHVLYRLTQLPRYTIEPGEVALLEADLSEWTNVNDDQQTAMFIKAASKWIAKNQTADRLKR